MKGQILSLQLNNLIAIVTGASSGIGEATAMALAKLGASVALVARREDRLLGLASRIESAGGVALPVVADITQKGEAERVVGEAIKRFGRLDILVNNAGVMIVGQVAEQDADSWDRMIDLNQKALLYMTKAAIPHLTAAVQQGPREVADIVNISSLAGREARRDFAVYSMTKFGVNAFTEGLRQELAPVRIRVGVLEPGAVNTELNDNHTGRVKEAISNTFASIEALEAEDIADGVAYMVTRPRRATVRELFILPSNQT